MIVQTTEPECFIYYLVPDRGEEYDRYHAEVWPEVLEALRLTGIVDYRIYRRGDLVISTITRSSVFVEVPLPERLAARLREWRVMMAPLFTSAADEAGDPLFATCVFSLTADQGEAS